MAEFLNPEKLLGQLKLRKDMVAAEFGSGAGVFSLLLAKRLEDGLVYALDVQEAPLSALKSRALLEKIPNLRIIRCNLEKPRGSTLADISVDLVLVANMLFQVENKTAVIAEAKRVLKPEGILVVVDWSPEATQGPTEKRVAPREVKDIAKQQGFSLENEFRVGNFHYAIIFKNK